MTNAGLHQQYIITEAQLRDLIYSKYTEDGRTHDKDRGARGWLGYTDTDEQQYLLNRLKEEVAELEAEMKHGFHLNGLKIESLRQQGAGER